MQTKWAQKAAGLVSVGGARFLCSLKLCTFSARGHKYELIELNMCTCSKKGYSDVVM